MPSHDDAAAKDLVGGIQRDERLALARAEETLDDGVALRIEIRPDARPIEGVDALRCVSAVSSYARRVWFSNPGSP